MNRPFSIILGSILCLNLLVITGYQAEEGSPVRSDEYSNHGSILIESDSDFTSSNGVISGSGSAIDPFVIRGWKIDADDIGYGISISNSTKHFVIEDCLIHGANNETGKTNPYTRDSNGIIFYNVRNGVIRNNEFFDNHLADIHLYSSSYNLITNNSCRSVFGSFHILIHQSTDNIISENLCDPGFKVYNPVNGTITKEYGIQIIYSSSRNLISHNYIYNHTIDGISISNNGNDNNNIDHNFIKFNKKGIDISGKGNIVKSNVVRQNSNSGISADMIYQSTIANNDVSYNQRSGISVNYDGSIGLEGGNDIHDNFVIQNGLDGIRILGKESNYHNNLIKWNGDDGICVWKNDNNTVTNNIVEENSGFGIFIEQYQNYTGMTVNNKVYSNNLINNSAGNQAMDQEMNNEWNSTSIGNYWNDHISPDSDLDGIVDLPYVVNATKNIYDNRPSTTPFTITVAGPEFLPEIVDTINRVFESDNSTTLNLKAKDKYIATILEWEMKTNASWLSLSGSTLKADPEVEDIGLYWIELKVFDKKGLFNEEMTSLNMTVEVIGHVNDTLNGTDPDDDPGNGTEPDDDPGNGTEPDDDPGNGTEPDDDPDGTPGNGTNEWNNETNRAPLNLTMAIPEGEIIEGESFTLHASSFDPDLVLGDELTFTWIIEGIGVVGTGESIDMDLDAGTHEITLVVTDAFGKSTEISREVVISEKEDGGSMPMYLPLILIALMVGLILTSLFILRRRQSRKEDAPEELNWDGEMPDIPTMTPGDRIGDIGDIKVGTLDGSLERNMQFPASSIDSHVQISLTPGEKSELKDIERSVLRSGRRSPSRRRKELIDILKKRRNKMDEDAYRAARSILFEE